MIHRFDAGEGRYGKIAEPRSRIRVYVPDLVVTRSERDRFEHKYQLAEDPRHSRADRATVAVDCSDDGGWIKVRGREYVFPGLLQKLAIRRLYEAWTNGKPRVNMQALLEDIESGSRHISQIFGAGCRNWREIVGYGSGHVWLKAEASSEPGR
jgi:hypothetical protein